MAKQVGERKLVGRVENFCCYKMGGAYFIRLESSLTGQRFWKEKAFEGSRRSCRLLAKASLLASRLYKRLPREKKGREAWRALTGSVKRLLREGYSEEGIAGWFQAHYLGAAVRRKVTRAAGRKGQRQLVVRLPVSCAGLCWGNKERKSRRMSKGLARGQPAVEGDSF